MGGMDVGVTNSYHNTTDSSGATRQTYEHVARGQERDILVFFQRIPPHRFTPSAVWRKLYNNTATPITSVRRGMSNLANPDKHEHPPLSKTTEQQTGPCGRPEYVWELAAQTKQQSNFGW